MPGLESFRLIRINTRYEPTPAEVAILRALARFHYLTVDQVVRLFYKPSMITTVRPRMKELAEHGFCERRALPLPPMLRGGSGAFVYTLGPKGRALVESLGMEVPARFRPAEMPQKNHLAHIVACSDVYVSASLLEKRDARFTLQRLLHERVLRSTKERVTVNGRLRRVVPDGWFALVAELGGRRIRFPIALEVDMGSEKQTKWRDKIRGLLAWIDGPYEKLFGTKYATVAVVCPARPKHAAVLCAWTEAELTELNRQADARHFVFTGANPERDSPTQLFLEPVWKEPFGQAPVPLLELGVATG